MVDFDVPCHIKKYNLKKYSEIIQKVKAENLSIVSHEYYHDEIVKILDPLTDDPDDQNEDEMSPIYWAAKNGHAEIVKILAPLTDNPNAPNELGNTPISWAAFKGHTEIVKILAPLIDNPNASIIK